VVERVDSLIVVGDRVVVSDIKLRIFLDHRLAGALGPSAGAGAQLDDAHEPQEQAEPGSGPATRRRIPSSLLVSRLPGAPQDHLVIAGLLFL